MQHMSPFNVPNKIPIVFHSESNYDYHFIMKEFANESEGEFECLGEITEKYKTFFVPIEKKIRKVDYDGNENIITISYEIRFMDSVRFMASSLSNLVKYLTKRTHKINFERLSLFS